ncbi:MAG: phosphodiester glycosidase family protein [Alicyclobacillus sp.]|nr:phosphodiester glycosidase family protein [Alicyclobacillus sp.]
MKPTRLEWDAPIGTRAARHQVRQQQKRRRWLKRVLAIVIGSFMLGVALVFAGFLTPFGTRVRMLIAETIITTRHYAWAKYLTTPQEYQRLVAEIRNAKVVNTGISGLVHVTGSMSDGPVQFQHISQDGYNGWVMFVHDPKLIRLVEANVHGSEGEYITQMGPRVGAIAGINASGFDDPNGNGWGGIPVGLEMVGGRLVSAAKPDPSWADVGFTSNGVMVMGYYTAAELRAMGVRDAMQFHPELVVNGKPMITSGDGGWGYGPRTAIGQTRDGTVICIVINGRLRAGSLGASMRQLQDLMLHYGAVNACAMDGGSSSVMYDAKAQHPILNSPSTIDPNGERHLPDAWMVFPTEQAANNYHA